MSNREKMIAFFLMLIFISGFYLYTMQPAAAFWDASQYLACGYSLGIAHPPGSPLHVVIRRVFSFLPITGDPAFSMNLFSAIPCAIASSLIFLMVVSILSRWKKPETRTDKAAIYSLGFASGSVSAFAFTPWWNAVEAEAYAPATFILVLCLWLATKSNSGKMIILVAYLFALSVGVHLLSLLAGPGILAFMLIKQWKTLRAKKNLIIGALTGWFFLILLSKWLAGLLGEDYSMVIAMLGAIILLAILPNIERLRSPLLRSIIIFILLIGFTTHLYLFVRSNYLVEARIHPSINQTEPTTPGRLWDTFTREQYGPTDIGTTLLVRQTATETGFSLPVAYFWQTVFYLRYFIWQFMPWPREAVILETTTHSIIQVLSVAGTALMTVLGVLGMYSLYKRDRPYFWLFFSTFLLCGLGLVLYLNFRFSPSEANPLFHPREVRERFYFFGASFLLFGAFVGFGLFELFERLKRLKRYLPPLAFAIGLLPLVANFRSPANRHGNFIPDNYAFNMLSSCSYNAILYTNGDNDTFPLWFAQAVRKTRQDIRVVNLSLINTDWYIRQVKRDMRVPISFTDFEIKNLMPHPVVIDGQIERDQILLINDFAVRDIAATNAGKNFERRVFMPIKRATLPERYQELFPRDMEVISPRYYRRRRTGGEWLLPERFWMRLPEEYLLPNDQFVELLMQDGYDGKYPIYFATTVSRDNTAGWEPYLSMKGLARRVTSTGGGPHFDVETTDSLLFDVFRYSSVFDESVYKDETTRKLLSNYGVAFFSLGLEHQRRGNIERAIESFEKGRKFEVRGIPFDQVLVNLYRMRGDDQKTREFLLQKVEKNPEPFALYALGKLALEDNNFEKAAQYFDRAERLDPQHPAGISGRLSLYYEIGDRTEFVGLRDSITLHPRLTGDVVGFLSQEGRRDIAREILTRWIELHPHDTIARNMLEGMGGI